MVAGNMSLVDEIGSVQLTIQSAIRSNTSPEILNMFMKKENASLRSRLASLESDLRLNKIPKDSFNTQAVDILKMLEKLGEELTPAEKELLNKVNVLVVCTNLMIKLTVMILCNRTLKI